MSSTPHRYRGHRSASFTPVDVAELVEIRARQRTFHGAYNRTAMVCLGYSIMILRLFERRFYKIGLLFAVLGGTMFVLAFLRARHSRHDFADQDKEGNELANRGRRQRHALESKNQGGRIFGRPFVTAGWNVLGVALAVAIAEVGMLVLVLEI